MKVLFLNTNDLNGGAARAANRIYNGVRLQGIETQFLVKKRTGENDQYTDLESFIPNIRLIRFLNWFSTKIKNKKQHYQWKRYKKLEPVYLSDMRSVPSYGALYKLNYDIIHLHWINQRFINLIELSKIGKPIVWTLHDSWAFCGICHYFLECDKYKTHCGNCQYLHSNIDKDLSFKVFDEKYKIYNNLDLHIVSPSQWLGDCAKESSLLGNFPIHIIPNAIDTDFFIPKLKQESLQRWFPNKKQGTRYLLYGAMNATTDKIKGFAYLLSALKQLSNKTNVDNIELLVFGSKDSIDNNDIQLKIHNIGELSNDRDLLLLYNLADVMLVPSLTENLSCTIMESLSCGTPVVAFNIGGNRDMIIHKWNGYLAQRENCEDFAEGIIYIMNTSHYDMLCRNAREKVVEDYSLSVIGNKYKDLYQQILNK